jgi:hypothetical protein
MTWNLPMPYGPMALPVFMLGGLISQLDVLVALYVVKLIWLLVHLGNAWLVYRIAKALEAAPGYAVFLFACNPLILLEQLGNGHNDGLMMFFGLLALFALLRGRPGLAVWLALLSGLVKLPGIFWWAAVVVYLLRRRQWRGLACGLAATFTTLLAVTLAFFPNPNALLSLTDTPWRFTQNSLHSLLIDWGTALCVRLKIPLGYEEVLRIDRVIFAGLFLIFCVWRLQWIRDFFSLIRELAHMYLGLLLGYAELLFPWYAAWLLPLAALTNSERLRWTIVAFSSASLSLYAFPYFLVEQAPRHWLWATTRLAVALAIPLGFWLRCFRRNPPPPTAEARSPMAAFSGRPVSLGAAPH